MAGQVPDDERRCRDDQQRSDEDPPEHEDILLGRSPSLMRAA
jgi:hypothetical protein